MMARCFCTRAGKAGGSAAPDDGIEIRHGLSPAPIDVQAAEKQRAAARDQQVLAVFSGTGYAIIVLYKPLLLSQHHA
jgi:hypothetical protein